MKLKKIRKIRTIKSIKTNILDFYVDEVKWPNNKKLKRALIRHRGVSVIVPILNKKEIIMEKQPRYGANQYLWEVPAGTIEKNESPLDCAKRELIEETGYSGKNWKNCGKYFTVPSYNTAVIHCYATECYNKESQKLDDDELIKLKSFTFKEIKRMLSNNIIKDAKTFIAITNFFKKHSIG